MTVCAHTRRRFAYPRLTRFLLVFGSTTGTILFLYFAFYFDAHMAWREYEDLYHERHPTRTFEDLKAEQQRELFHRMIDTPGWAHWVPYSWLRFAGNESSVPLIIDAMRWAPKPRYDPLVLEHRDLFERKGHVLPAHMKMPPGWEYGFIALEHITHQPLPPYYSAWNAWFETNKHKSRIEWITDGFRLRGVPLVFPPDEKSVRLLIEQFDRPAHYENRYLPYDQRGDFHALWMLRHYDRDLTSRVVGKIAHNGTVEQRRGLARYGRWVSPRTVDWGALVDGLKRDADRKVRLWATWAEATRHRGKPDLETDSVTWNRFSIRKADWEWSCVNQHLIGRAEDLARVDLRTAQVVWTIPFDSRANEDTPNGFIPIGNRLFLNNAQGFLICVSAETGETLWKSSSANLGYVVSRSAEDAVATSHGHYLDAGNGNRIESGTRPCLLHENGLFVRRESANTLAVADSVNGPPRFVTAAPHEVRMAELIGDLLVYVQFESVKEAGTDIVDISQQRLWITSVNLADGRQVYHGELAALEKPMPFDAPGLTARLVASDRLLVSIRSPAGDTLRAFDPGSGELQWEVGYAPVLLDRCGLVGRVLFARPLEGQTVMLDVRTGEFLGTCDFADRVAGLPGDGGLLELTSTSYRRIEIPERMARLFQSVP